MIGTAFWTQLRDITIPDVIQVDGSAVPEESQEIRSRIVDHISRVSLSRRRYATQGGGFVAWGPTTSVAEIPASMPNQTGFYPSIMVCIRNGTLTPSSSGEILRDTESFAAASGLVVDPKQVEEALDTLQRGYRGGCLPVRTRRG